MIHVVNTETQLCLLESWEQISLFITFQTSRVELQPESLHSLQFSSLLACRPTVYACSWSASDNLYLFFNFLYMIIYEKWNACIPNMHFYCMFMFDHEAMRRLQPFRCILSFFIFLACQTQTLIWYNIVSMCTPHSLRAVTLLNLSFTGPTWHMTLTDCLWTKGCLYIFHIPFFHPSLFHLSIPSNPSFAELWLFHLLLYFFSPSPPIMPPPYWWQCSHAAPD